MQLNMPLNEDAANKIQPATPEEKTVAQVEAERKVMFEQELEEEYIDYRTITISLVHNYSNYRQVNMKALGQRKETIGSSVTSSRTLSSNKEEVEAYFPALIGLASNHPDFMSRVKSWLNNIQFTINENDVKLNTTFIYRHKRDYLAIKEKEDKIEAEYEKVNRSDLSAIKDAIKRRVRDLNTLESSKHKYGYPQNLEEYLIYRHCLLYRDVAKDPALINSDASLRFYIKDENKEIEKKKKLTEEKKKAMRNFVELSSSDSKFNSMYVSIVVQKGDNLNVALMKDHSMREAVVMDYVNNNPDKFNKLYSDKYLSTKSFIETLIAKGELVRSEYNQNISTPDGTFIGANMNDVVAYFNNPDNKEIKTALENKLKLI